MPAGSAFTKEQHQRLERAAVAASGQTGIRFYLRVGPAEGDATAAAGRLLAGLARPEEEAVLVFVAPAERVVEIVTTAAARRRLTDKACALAALSMTTSFAAGDLVGGIVNGVRMLADAAGRVHALAPGHFGAHPQVNHQQPSGVHAAGSAPGH